jgi:hypothetical protein
VILLAAGENHAVTKTIGSLRTNQARFEQPFQGVAEGLQVRTQVATAGIADAEFLDELGIMHSALRETLNAFRITVQFKLIEAGGVREQLRGGGEFFLEIGDALAEKRDGATVRQSESSRHPARSRGSRTDSYGG